MSILRTIPVVLLACALVLPAAADVGHDTWVYPDRGGTEPVSLCCFPDGTGKAFSEAFLLFGGETDATLTIRLQYGPDFIAHFPREDIWLESWDDNLVFCIVGSAAGTCPDADTDADGYTHWAEPLATGGRCEAGAGDRLVIRVNGDVPLDGIVADFSINSPDINGDGAVDLADIGLFSQDYYGVYSYRSDFRWDQNIDLGDIGLLAQAFGGSCP